MHTITARNVNGAYAAGLGYLTSIGREESSRAGAVLVAPGPVTTAYGCPAERVLFSAQRDTNPFFHIAEALWMLAGRNDAKLLNRYVKDFGARFAEVNGRVHGAYGHRWRQALGYDQLAFVIEKLKREPETRQCVLQMWDAADLQGNWRDRPCNTHAYFRLNQGVLDMMVCCRSNDAIWGAYGANVVHFSVLQEYMAAMIGAGIGIYHQVSFNFHAYLDILAKVGAPQSDDRYAAPGLTPVPLVASPESFDCELAELLAMMDRDEFASAPGWANGFLADSALPLLRAHSHWAAGRRERAYEGLEQVMAPDWRIAAQEWMERRLRRA